MQQMESEHVPCPGSDVLPLLSADVCIRPFVLPQGDKHMDDWFEGLTINFQEGKCVLRSRLKRGTVSLHMITVRVRLNVSASVWRDGALHMFQLLSSAFAKPAGEFGALR